MAIITLSPSPPPPPPVQTTQDIINDFWQTNLAPAEPTTKRKLLKDVVLQAAVVL
jgi:hypothetical protein